MAAWFGQTAACQCHPAGLSGHRVADRWEALFRLESTSRARLTISLPIVVSQGDFEMHKGIRMREVISTTLVSVCAFALTAWTAGGRSGQTPERADHHDRPTAGRRDERRGEPMGEDSPHGRDRQPTACASRNRIAPIRYAARRGQACTPAACRTRSESITTVCRSTRPCRFPARYSAPQGTTRDTLASGTCRIPIPATGSPVSRC